MRPDLPTSLVLATLALAFGCRTKAPDSPTPEATTSKQEAAPAPSNDDPAPPGVAHAFEVRFTTAWNRHSSFGGDGERHESVLTAELFEDGRLLLVDEGENVQTTSSHDWGYEKETTTWSITSSGEWTNENDVLVLDLTDPATECEQHVRDYDGTETKTDCPDLPDPMRLECRTSHIDVGETFTTPGDEKTEVKAWSCFPTQQEMRYPGSPLAWMLVDGDCIRISWIPSGKRSFAFCEHED